LGKGILQIGQLCHQQPCTKTASFDLGYTKSGLPGNTERISFLLSSLARINSGVVPELLFDRIDLETATEDGFGALMMSLLVLRLILDRGRLLTTI
jgi:hypothetical protein